LGYIGRALSARTTQETTAGNDILVDLAINRSGSKRQADMAINLDRWVLDRHDPNAKGDYRFAGLSTEAKLTTGADGTALAAGCEFYESDTGNTYYWTGTSWALKPLRMDYGVTQSGQSSADLTRYFLILIREQRLTNTLLAQAQGMPALFPSIPEIDSLTIA
jgi:hypothetical protein